MSEFFFFQAEDGIRDYKVTGVQTCALPISQARRQSHGCVSALWRPVRSISKRLSCFGAVRVLRLCFVQRTSIYLFCAAAGAARACRCRSEEHTSELQSPCNLVCRLLLEKKNR